MNKPFIADLLPELEKVWFGGREIRPVTKRLVKNLFLDLPLSPAERVDFGVKTDDHYRALKAVLNNTAETVEIPDLAEELDGLLGNGPGLTALVERYAPEYAGIRFKTPYDDFPW